MEILKYLKDIKDILIFLGLLLNLIGAYKLYLSVMAFPEYRGIGGKSESYPIAVLNIRHAKSGFIFVIFGIILQLLASISVCS